MSPIELTDSELDYFRANYGRLTNTEIGEHLHVCSKTVCNLANRYGIEPVPKPCVGSRAYNNGRPWTPKDHKIFLMMIDAHYTYREIALLLGRTIRAVISFKSLYYPDYPSPRRHSQMHDSTRDAGGIGHDEP